MRLLLFYVSASPKLSGFRDQADMMGKDIKKGERRKEKGESLVKNWNFTKEFQG